MSAAAAILATADLAELTQRLGIGALLLSAAALYRADCNR
jgi:hypothetical protein